MYCINCGTYCLLMTKSDDVGPMLYEPHDYFCFCLQCIRSQGTYCLLFVFVFSVSNIVGPIGPSVCV